MCLPDPIQSDIKRVTIARLVHGWLVVFDNPQGSRSVVVAGGFDAVADYVRSELMPKPFFDGDR